MSDQSFGETAKQPKEEEDARCDREIDADDGCSVLKSDLEVGPQLTE